MKAVDLNAVARALGGEVNGEQVLAPSPGYPAADRSLSVTLDPNAPNGFVAHSSADDAFISPFTDCQVYVGDRLLIARLATFDRLTYEQCRTNVAKHLRITPSALDKLVAEARRREI